MSSLPMLKVKCLLSAFDLRCLVGLIESMTVADLPTDTQESIKLYHEIMQLKYYLQNQLNIIEKDSEKCNLN